jgi:hypothetical protein
MSEEKEKVESFLREWFKTRFIVYPSDAADALKMDYSKAMEIFDKLEAEGKLERAKFAGGGRFIPVKYVLLKDIEEMLKKVKTNGRKKNNL